MKWLLLIIALIGLVYISLNWLPFLMPNSRFQDNLDRITRITVNVSEYISDEENSYRNIDVENSEQRDRIISLVKQEKIDIPFMGLYETDFETKHWLVQFYTQNYSDMYVVYVNENKIFDKKVEKSNLYRYLKSEFN